MTSKKAIEIMQNMKNHAERTDDKELMDACDTAIKALETVQRIDDVLNVEGMTEIDVLDEIMEAVSEFKYDCGVSE